MNLAKDKNGKIGRQVPSPGLTAKVSPGFSAERRGNVMLSQAQIETDQAYWENKEREALALKRAEAFARQVKAQAQKIAQEKQAKRATEFQALAKVDPMNEKLKTFFARKGMMGETAQVAESIRLLPPAPAGPVATYGRDLSATGAHWPADFSASGGNVQYVEGSPMTGGDQWRADFRQHHIVGNPLTRDGVYGPGVTDFDRIARGVDVNQLDVVQVSGGTILGRLDGSPVAKARTMGFDWSWDGITDTISNVADQTVDNVVDKLPDQLAKELQNAVGGGGRVSNTSGGTITVQRPITGAVTTVSQSMGVPPWAIYAGVGMIGLGFLLVMVKTLKS